MNYIDKNIKEISNNDTIGILICKRENNKILFLKKYKYIYS